MSPEPHPLITIGVTCFNAGDTIEAAVKSALAQDWPNIEIIVVDDCSTDSSAETLKTITDKRVRVITHAVNKGYPGALNTIVQNAGGELIAFFDDDDISRPDRLSKQYERLINYQKDKGTEMVLCYSDRDIQLPGDDEPKYDAQAIGRAAPEPHGPMVADYILLYSAPSSYCWGIFGSCTLMAHKDVFAQTGPFDEGFRRSAEWDYAIRAAQQGAHFIAVPEPLILQRKTLSSDKSDQISQNFKIALRKKHKDYLKRKRGYLASLVIAHAGKRRHRIRYMAARALSLALAPHIFLKNKLAD